MHHKISVGDDIEDFVKRAIANEINNNELGLRVYGGSMGIGSFHLALLTHQEKNRLEMNDKDYTKTYQPWLYSGSRLKSPIPNRAVDVPKAEMDASESKQKYALSRCTRRTYPIVSEDVALYRYLQKHHPNMTNRQYKLQSRENFSED